MAENKCKKCDMPLSKPEDSCGCNEAICHDCCECDDSCSCGCKGKE